MLSRHLKARMSWRATECRRFQIKTRRRRRSCGGTCGVVCLHRRTRECRLTWCQTVMCETLPASPTHLSRGLSRFVCNAKLVMSTCWTQQSTRTARLVQLRVTAPRGTPGSKCPRREKRTCCNGLPHSDVIRNPQLLFLLHPTHLTDFRPAHGSPCSRSSAHHTTTTQTFYHQHHYPRVGLFRIKCSARNLSGQNSTSGLACNLS
mgnify:CR=1 FL=1